MAGLDAPLHEDSVNQARNRAAPQGTGLATTGIVANYDSKLASVLSATSSKRVRPVCDEWGVYDPEQAGLEAVMRRLSENEEVKLAKRANARTS